MMIKNIVELICFKVDEEVNHKIFIESDIKADFYCNDVDCLVMQLHKKIMDKSKCIIYN